MDFEYINSGYTRTEGLGLEELKSILERAYKTVSTKFFNLYRFAQEVAENALYTDHYVAKKYLKTIQDNLDKEFWEQVEKGDWIDSDRKGIYCCVSYYDKDGQGYSGSKWINKADLLLRRFRVSKDHHGYFNIHVLDTVFDRKTWKAEKPINPRR